MHIPPTGILAVPALGAEFYRYPQMESPIQRSRDVRWSWPSRFNRRTEADVKSSAISTTTLIFFLAMPVLGHASIIIEPPRPTSEDYVLITVSGEYSNPCFEIFSSHEINGNTITISVQIVPIGEVCIQVITPWSVTEEIGQLPPGGYEVTAIIDTPCCFPCNPPLCIEEASFRVIPAGEVSCLEQFVTAVQACLQSVDVLPCVQEAFSTLRECQGTAGTVAQ